MTDLFVKPLSELDFEKVATYSLPRNTAMWNQEILKILYEEYSWLNLEGAQPIIQYQGLDPDLGVAVGSISVVYEPMPDKRERSKRAKSKVQDAPAPIIRIPLIINDFKLHPFDVFIAQDGTMQPLSPSRVAESVQPPDNFSGLYQGKVHTEPIGDITQVPSSVNTRYGHNLGDGADMAGMEHYASYEEQNSGMAYDGPMMAQILPTLKSCDMERCRKEITRSPAILQSWSQSGAAGYLDSILQADGLSPDDYKNIQDQVLPSNVFHFIRTKPGMWRVTIYSDLLYSPKVEEYGETELLAQFAGVPTVVEKVWENEEFIVTMDREHVKPFVLSEGAIPEVEQATSGLYVVPTEDGDICRGAVLNRVADYLGNDQALKLFIGDRAVYGLADGMVGGKTGDLSDWMCEEDVVGREWATFVTHDASGYRAYLPFRVRQQFVVEGAVCMHAIDFHGNSVTFRMTPGLRQMESVTGVTSPWLGDLLGANVFRVPTTFMLKRLGKRVNICRTEKDYESLFKRHTLNWIVARGQGKRRTNAVYIKQIGDEYKMEGDVLKPFLHSADGGGWGVVNGVWRHKKAKLALVLLGVSLDDAEAILSMANEATPVIVSNLRPIADAGRVEHSPSKTILPLSKLGSYLPELVGESGDTAIEMNWDEFCEDLRRPLYKEAAVLKDDDAIDSVLSLDFISPENLVVYIQNIPRFREVANRLAEMLVLSRVGLKPVPERAIYNAMKGLTEVTDSLALVSMFLREAVDPHVPDEVEMTPDQHEAEGAVEEKQETAESA
jgi:hypothetical protein